MPYRHAHLVLLFLLAPMIVVAFWRDYFGALPTAAFAYHIHGLSAVLWLSLLTAQSWAAHSRRLPLHRKLGLATFAAVPLFTAGATFVVHSMAEKMVAGHPFYGVFGARLGLHDIVSTVALVAMVAMALRHRRRVGIHAGYMLATALLVFPPIMARLPLPFAAPPWAHLGEVLPTLLALVLASTRRRDAEPMLAVAGLLVGQIVLFHTVGASAAWEQAFRAIAAAPLIAVGMAALALAMMALLVLIAAWKPARMQRAARPV